MSSIAKDKQDSMRMGFWSELFQLGAYKPNQGKVVRQVTFGMIALLGILSAWELYRSGAMNGLGGAAFFALLGMVLFSLWLAWRIVNYSVFADFLVAVEAEMNKVSWPSKKEVWNASMVVIFVIFAMSAFLFVFDIVWTWLFETIGIRYSDKESYLLRFFRWIFGG